VTLLVPTLVIVKTVALCIGLRLKWVCIECARFACGHQSLSGAICMGILIASATTAVVELCALHGRCRVGSAVPQGAAAVEGVHVCAVRGGCRTTWHPVYQYCTLYI